MALTRVLEPEVLDHLEPDDPRAQRARRDLRRINRVMGAAGILRRALEGVLPARTPADPPLRLVEIGCGDGHLMLDVARQSRGRWPRVEIALLDRQPVVDPGTIAAYASVGWTARPLTADVLAWVDAGPGDDRQRSGRVAGSPRVAMATLADDPGAGAGATSGRGGDREAAATIARGASPGASGKHFDAVVANLFLHHFDAATLRDLLAGCARRADSLVACEPRRSRFALAASHLVGFVGAGAVARTDAVLSVRAGFLANELTAAWGPGADHVVEEYDDGLFTHVFRAAPRR